MSGLLPFIVEVLKDKTILEVQKEEHTKLRKVLELRNSVEIIKYDEWGDIVAVYAAGRLKDGNFISIPRDFAGGYDPVYEETYLQVNLTQSEVSCSIEDLRNCEVCVGGGFRIVDFELRQVCSDWDDDNEILYMYISLNSYRNVRFRMDRVRLKLAVFGLSKTQYETRLEKKRFRNGSLINVLVSEFPNTTVEFKDVSLYFDSIEGPLKRILNPEEKQKMVKKKEEFDAQMMAEEEAWEEHLESMNSI